MGDWNKNDGFEQNMEHSEMRTLVPRIATIEIPVTDLRRSIDWYGKMLGVKPQGEWHEQETGAMLHVQGGSVIDLYTHDLNGYYHFLKENGADVNEIDWEREPHRPGFGFRDCDGNSLGVSNVEFKGQGHENTDHSKAHPFVLRVAGVGIPVKNLKKAIAWYTAVFGMKVLGEPQGDGEAAMLYLDGGERLGVPNFYLVETEDEQRLAFVNTYTNVTHSVIDFYSANVTLLLTELQSRGVQMNGTGGFFDPDGNSLAVCSAVHRGQVN
jgi:catechol 2,3-dioxygenase-like lactoylglutathione lyase family enzyme